MADVFQTFDKHGKPHKRWRFRYTDYLGVRRKGTGYTSKSETQKLVDRIDAEQHAIRKGYAPRPTKASEPRRIADVVKEYLAWGRASGGKNNGPWAIAHAEKREARLEWWRRQLRCVELHELIGIQATVENECRKLLTENIAKPGKPAKYRTPQTVQRYADAIRGLCSWAYERGYFNDDPLKRLKALPRQTKHVRRAMTPDEIKRLLKTCWPSHRVLYQMALATGLRANELRSATVAHIDFERGGMKLEAAWTKNRKPGFQYLAAALMAELGKVTAGKAPNDSLIHVGDHPARDLDADLKRADIQKHAPGGKIDFHALRTAFSTLLDNAGASAAENMQMMRHATPQQTFGAYTKARNSRLAELAELVGEVISDGPKLAQRKAGGK